MHIRSILGSASVFFGLLLLPHGAVPHLHAQTDAETRIWGEVHTRDGAAHEGFLRWDRNEVGWDDLLDGSRRISAEVAEAWEAAVEAGAEVEERSIEFMGYRITWDDDPSDFRQASESSIRFGHLDSLRVLDDDRARLWTRSGEEIEFSSTSTDLGADLRDLVVDAPGREPLELRWAELDRVTFRAAPAGARASSRRLFGTAVDAWGGEWTGWISWDMDEALAHDVLDGEDEDGGDREIPFEEIERIVRLGWRGAEVHRRDGSIVVLSGSNDVDDGHRGVLVSDPGIGLVTLPWEDVEEVRFREPDAGARFAARRSAWDGGTRIRGTVEREGDLPLHGRIRWDADEAWGWEILDGRVRDTEFDVEFDRIARIVKNSSRGSTVTLRDGRVLELEDSNDVDGGNRGLFVETDQGETIYVDWYDVISVELEETRTEAGR